MDDTITHGRGIRVLMITDGRGIRYTSDAQIHLISINSCWWKRNT